MAIQTHFEKELSDLKETLLTMASHSEAAVKNAVEALTNRDYDLAQRVREDADVLRVDLVEVLETGGEMSTLRPIVAYGQD